MNESVLRDYKDKSQQGWGKRRMRLLTVILAAVGVMHSPANAQESSDGPIYMDADTLVEDRTTGRYIASGGVRLQSGNRVLTADEIEYDPETGRVIARGNVRIFDGDMPAQLADEIELDSTINEGIARGFAAMFEGNGRAAAAGALRRADGSVELTNGYYTACELCADSDDEPTWRLRASRVTRDVEDQMIYYRDARLEILGFPVFFSPIFAHPDPSTPRKSGLLMPSIDVSDRLGFSYQQPYLWVISPYEDLVVAPRLMTEVSPLLELDYRRRFYSGQLNIQTSFTYEQEFDQDGLFGDEEFRWHVFADGRFQITDNWDWGFGVQEVSEDLYLRRYDYTETPERGAGIYKSENRYLSSQVYAQGRGESFFADVAAIRINSLLENQDDDELPFITPLVRFNSDLPFPDWAGTLQVNASSAVLTREDGDDYARVSFGGEWDRPMIIPGGLKAEPYAFGRLDAYALTETDADGVETDTRNFVRGVAAGGLELSYPFIRHTSWGHMLVSPRLHSVFATGLEEEDFAINEDGRSVDLDSLTLFERNRTGGYDIWENGSRIDFGISTEMNANNQLPDIEVFAGRSVRLNGAAPFEAGSGLNNEESDWVAEFKVDVGSFDFAARTRIDSESNDLNRTDFITRFDFWRINGLVDYTRLTVDGVSQRESEDITARFAYEINDRWDLQYQVVRDLDAGKTRRASASLRYRDECTDFRIVYERKDFEIGNLGPSESIKFQITLFTLGSVQDD